MDNEQSGSERDLLSQRPEGANALATSTDFMRGMNSNCQIPAICTSVYMLSNLMQPFVH